MKYIQKRYWLDNRIAPTLLLALWTTLALGQAFESSEGGLIFDKTATDIVPTIYTIKVERLPTKTDANFGLEKVCFHLRHKRPTDLKIELLSPSGTSVWISNRNGQDNTYGYLNTCVTANGFNGPLYQSDPMYRGEYTAEGRLDFFNQGEDPNGIWSLVISDLSAGVVGKLESFSLYYGTEPAYYNTSTCSESEPSHCITTDQSNRLLPNLIVSEKLTADNIVYFDSNHDRYPGQLRFAAAMANVGEGPLHIVTEDNWYCGETKVLKSTICDDGSSPINTVEQLIATVRDNALTYDTLTAGTLYYDAQPGHNHYHVENWARFTVLKKRWWTNNPKRWKQIAVSDKVSYCLFDNKICTADNGYCTSRGVLYSSSNLANYGLGSFSTCDSHLQGISVGGIDYYGAYYEGQHVSLPSNMRKGKYYLRIEVDPNNEYLESREDDNSILVPFSID